MTAFQPCHQGDSNESIDQRFDGKGSRLGRGGAQGYNPSAADPAFFLRQWRKGSYNYTECWNKTGPILDEQKIEFMQCLNPDYVKARVLFGKWVPGPTRQIAALRSYVTSTLGDEIDVPEGLLQ